MEHVCNNPRCVINFRSHVLKKQINFKCFTRATFHNTESTHHGHTTKSFAHIDSVFSYMHPLCLVIHAETAIQVISRQSIGISIITRQLISSKQKRTCQLTRYELSVYLITLDLTDAQDIRRCTLAGNNLLDDRRVVCIGPRFSMIIGVLFLITWCCT